MCSKCQTRECTHISYLFRDEELKDGGHLHRLVKDEEHLRREQDLITNMEDKELMILLQQRKIAALDEANTRWVNVVFSV